MYQAIKSLGQNFLVDFSFADKMVALLDLKPHDTVIEVGPGLGALTDRMAPFVRENPGTKVIAVEIDNRFYEKLLRQYAKDEHLILVEGNILDFLPRYIPDGEFKIIGSLPYYITSPILHAVAYMEQLPTTCVFLIQKEVAQKITAKAPDSSYMSAFLQTFFNIEYVHLVPKHVFSPKPEVDGGIIKLTRREGNWPIELKQKYEGFLHKAYKNPRKMLNKAFSKEELEKGGINPTLRPQNLGSDEWVKFFQALN